MISNWIFKTIKTHGRWIGMSVGVFMLIFNTSWLLWFRDMHLDNYPTINPCAYNNMYKSSKCITKTNDLIEYENYNLKILTADCPSRLGNQMFSYAILYAISIYNQHSTAYMSPVMSNYISKYFKVSLNTLDDTVYESIQWNVQYLGANVPTNIKNLTDDSPIKFCCYPQTWKYFNEIRPRILHEFRWHNYIEKQTQNILSNVKKQFIGQSKLSTKPVFIGVHVRRTDFINEVKRINFYIPSIEYYKNAMIYFETKYINTIFIIASDDIVWCQNNFENFNSGIMNFMIYYINGTSPEDGGLDLAILSKCDHIIFGLGTFGWWAGYLNPGEVIYCSDCITNESVWFNDGFVYGRNYGNFVLPSWKGLSRSGS